MLVYCVLKSRQSVEVDSADLIPLAEAARLSGRSLSVIAAMLDRGRLPWYELPEEIPGRRGARYTSRKAVMRLKRRRKRGGGMK